MSTAMSIPDVVVERWPIENITPYRLNVKKHEKDQIKRLCAAIVRSGRFDVPIVVDKDGVIIKGHGRRLAALELGMKFVPVICHRDITPEQAREMRLADNRVAISDIDTEMLKVELEGLDLANLDGIFDIKELDFFTADLGHMSVDPFVGDMDVVIADQKTDMAERVEKAASSRVPLHKAFGFKDISVASQIHITRLMGKAEAATGLTGEEALIAYAAAL